jgi:isochorismate hydrolase
MSVTRSAISGITTYSMPTEPELPENVVSWRPDPNRAVLVIHDMQKYFVGMFPAGQAPVTDLVSNVARLKRVADELSIPVVYTAQPGSMLPQERGLLHDFWGPGMDRTPEHREIVDELAPREGDVVLTKWRYSAFFRTDLDEHIRALHRDQAIICGVYAHVGCLMTAVDSFTRDLETFFVADAVADFTREDHTMALDYAAQRCAVTITTSRLIDTLSDGAPNAARLRSAQVPSWRS